MATRLRALPASARAALILLALALAALPFTTVYRGLNAGITVGQPGYSVGFEWRGNVGPFADFDGADDSQPRP
ncbi:hypothetical protein ACX9I7_00680 [Streptomyces sp. L500]